MITTNNLTHLLHILKFDSSDNKVFSKQYPHFNCTEIQVDLIRLLDKGYRPESIELEKEWKLGKTRT